MLKYLYGEDTYGARQAVEEYAKKVGGRLRWLDYYDLERQPLSHVLDQGSSGLFGRQVVVIKDASGLPKNLQEDIIAAVSKNSRADCIVWDWQLPDKRSALYRALKPVSRQFSYPNETTLVKRLMARAKDSGTVLDQAAARLMIERLGPNSWRLLSEVDRLALTVPEITTAVVTEQVPYENMPDEVFPLLDALVAGRLEVALSKMKELLAQGRSEFYLLTMLAYQYRSLLKITEGLARGQSATAIARSAGLHPYVVQKNYAVARRQAPAQVLDSLTRILATDFSIKQGKVEARTGLTMLVLGLARPARES